MPKITDKIVNVFGDEVKLRQEHYYDISKEITDNICTIQVGIVDPVITASYVYALFHRPESFNQAKIFWPVYSLLAIGAITSTITYLTSDFVRDVIKLGLNEPRSESLEYLQELKFIYNCHRLFYDCAQQKLIAIAGINPELLDSEF